MIALIIAAPGLLGLLAWAASRAHERVARAVLLAGMAGAVASLLWFSVEPGRDGWPNFLIGLLFYPSLALLSGGLAAMLKGAGWWAALPAAAGPYILSWGTLTLIEPH